MAKRLPRIIYEARAKIASFVHSDSFRHGRRDHVRAMKSDFAERVIAVVSTLLLSCCLEFEGGFCRVSGDTARPLTVRETATLSDVHQRAVERIFQVLREYGLMNSEKQLKQPFMNGYKVAVVWRVFTKKFWEALGLWGLFVESVKYASKNRHLNLKRQTKIVGKKGKSIAAQEAERTQSARNNYLFKDMLTCPNRRHAKNCPGGYKPEETCAICRKFPD